MSYQSVFVCLLITLLSISYVHSSSISKRRVPSFFDNELAEKALVSDGIPNYTNKLILRLVDAAIEDARERGASLAQVEDMMRKRGGIQKCFFHAVNCW